MRSISACPTAAGTAFTAIVRFPKGSRVEAGGPQFVLNPRVFDLLLGRQLQNHRHQQLLHFRASGCLLRQHLFKQDTLMCHMLIDNPGGRRGPPR